MEVLLVVIVGQEAVLLPIRHNVVSNVRARQCNRRYDRYGLSRRRDSGLNGRARLHATRRGTRYSLSRRRNGGLHRGSLYGLIGRGNSSLNRSAR